MKTNVNKYIESIETASKHGRKLMCTICGTETHTLGSRGMCSNCENILYTNRNELAKSNNELVGFLDNINRMIKVNKYDRAIKLYDELHTKTGDESLLYAQGLVYIRASNYEISQIYYTRGSFMEENSVHRSRSTYFMGMAKLLLNKVAYKYQSSLNTAESKNSMYMLLLIQLKLKRYRAAQQIVELLSKQNDEYLTNYAKMIFYSNTGNFKDTLKQADMLAVPESFSVNALHYAALALLKGKRPKDSKKLLMALSSQVKTESSLALLKEIKAFESPE